MQKHRLSLDLPDEAATEKLGRVLGENLRPGGVVLLYGGLGAGKTTLARGLARGLGVGDDYAITSPTFTLLNVYPGRIAFYHADLYRLDADSALDLGLLEEAAQGVLAVEWAEIMEGHWPADALVVRLGGNETLTRQAELSGPEALLKELAEAEL